MASRVGRAFVAVRDGEVAAESLGVDLLRTKALAFGVSGFYAGVAGGLYSAMLNFVAPEGFDLFQMVLQKSMIVVGGLGSITGSLLGAGVIIVLLETLRAFEGLQEIVFGGLLVCFVLFVRGGLVRSSRARLPGWQEPLRVIHCWTGWPRLRPSTSQQRRSIDECGTSLRSQSPARLRRGEGPRWHRSRREAGRDTWTDWPQWRRQDHTPQRHMRHPPATRRERPAGRYFDRWTEAERHRPERIGRTFQTSQLFRGMTVLENMMAGLHRHTSSGLFSAGLQTRRCKAEEARIKNRHAAP